MGNKVEKEKNKVFGEVQGNGFCYLASEDLEGREGQEGFDEELLRIQMQGENLHL